MPNGRVIALCVASVAGAPMEARQAVLAEEGVGLLGDRYGTGEGSFNKGKRGKRQVTLINDIFFDDSHSFSHLDTRRNIVVDGVELNWLIGREFQIGEAVFRGVKYCDPCNRPTKLSGKDESFQEAFFDRGGLVAEVIKTGKIRVGDEVIPPPKGY